MYRFTFIFLILCATITALATDPKRPGPVTFEPCRYWQYDFQSNGYDCRWKGTRVSVYDVMSVDNKVSELQKKLDDLEKRVVGLENKP